MSVLKAVRRSGEIHRFLKYCAVGVLNTAVCLGVIFICKSIIGLNPYLSNVLGYGAGLLNSFLWNRKWVFRSDGQPVREAARFILGFALCYALQFIIVWTITNSSFGEKEFELWVFTLSGYGIATLAGNVAYTIANFFYNRHITFR